MVDLSVLKNFEPVSLSSTKDSSGDGITFESELNPFLKSDSLDADKLAKKIQQEAEKLKADKAKQLELIERSLAYVRAKGGSDLSSEVYEQLKNKDSSEFIDVFGKSDKVPTNVENSTSAKVAWGQIMTGAAYDHIEKNKNPIAEDLKSALSEADDKKILKVADNPALVKLIKIYLKCCEKLETLMVNLYSKKAKAFRSKWIVLQMLYLVIEPRN
jgi:ribosomal protein S7